jgi:hypothetical protein
LPIGLRAVSTPHRARRTHAPGVVADGQAAARLAGEVVAEEQPADGVEHAARHLHHVLHDLLDGRVRLRHVHGADGDHEVQAREDVPRVLHELVQVREVVLAGLVRLAEVVGQVPERVKHGHVCVRARA